MQTTDQILEQKYEGVEDRSGPMAFAVFTMPTQVTRGPPQRRHCARRAALAAAAVASARTRVGTDTGQRAPPRASEVTHVVGVDTLQRGAEPTEPTEPTGPTRRGRREM